MATWDAADLLQRLKLELQRPTVDAALSSAQAYQLLSDAQVLWMRTLADHVPEANMGAPIQLSTTDRMTYTFPDGVEPLGHTEVRDGRRGPVLIPGSEFDDWADFTIEASGTVLRVPSGRTRSFPNGLWVRCIPAPGVIDGTHDPTLLPKQARLLIVYQAAADWARLGGLRDPAPYLQKLQAAAWGDPMNPGDVGIIGSLKTMYFGQGSSSTAQQPGVWWHAPGWL